MTAMAKNQGPLLTRPCGDRLHRRPWAGTFKASKHAYLTSLCMQVDGVARPLLSGSSMDALATAVGTTDAGLLLTARRKGVKFAIIDPGGNSKERHILITHSTEFTIVSLYAATGGGGAITTTALEAQDAIRDHAIANSLLRVKLAGTGASAVVAAAAASVVSVEMLGCSELEIDETTAADITLPLTTTFTVNEPGSGTGLLSVNVAPVEGGEACLIDDQTCSATEASALDLRGPCVGVENSWYYIDLARVN